MTSYTGKKQKNSSNASAVLAKTIAFHKHTTTVLDNNHVINKCLLQRCANTLGRLQEFSAQEAVGYVMGWGDHLVSHHYSPIYLNGIRMTLFHAFPKLRCVLQPAAMF